MARTAAPLMAPDAAAGPESTMTAAVFNTGGALAAAGAGFPEPPMQALRSKVAVSRTACRHRRARQWIESMLNEAPRRTARPAPGRANRRGRNRRTRSAVAMRIDRCNPG